MQSLGFWHLLALMGLVWFSAMSGVFVGAMFVFRTKREPHESLWQWQRPKGQAFNLEDETDVAGAFPRVGSDAIPGVKENEDKRTKVVGRFNKMFLNKIYGDLEAQAPENEETGT